MSSEKIIKEKYLRASSINTERLKTGVDWSDDLYLKGSRYIKLLVRPYGKKKVVSMTNSINSNTKRTVTLYA